MKGFVSSVATLAAISVFVAESTVSENITVKAGEGYSYKIFVFNSTEGLKPLADMFIK
jgi:hypothetical protein